MRPAQVLAKASCVILLLAAAVVAGVPELMNYQGRLTDNGGTPLDTTVSMTFTIYDDSTGGNPIWTETHSVVTVTGGSFNVLLGSLIGVPDTLWWSTRYLSIAVGADSEILPRTPITSTPYSFISHGVDGHIQTAQDQIRIGDPAAGFFEIGAYETDILERIYKISANYKSDQGDSSEFVLQASAGGASFVLTDSMGDTTVSIDGGDGTIHATGAIRSGNTLVINGPNDDILSPSGEMYLGREASPGSSVFDQDIKVGVGTTTPGARLEVYGSTTASMPLLLLKHMPASPTGILDNVFEIYNHYFGYRAFSINGGGIVSQCDGSSGLANVLNPSGPSYFNSPTGGVGIGTASPNSNYALHVEGKDRGIYAIATQGTSSVRPYGIMAGLNTTNLVNTGGGLQVSINKQTQAPNITYLIGGDITLTKGSASGALLGLRVLLNDETADDYGIQLQVEDPGYAIYSVDDGRVYLEGNVGVGTDLPTAKLDVNGATGYDQIRMRTSFTPTGTADASGNVGDIAWDDNFIYIKTSAGWKRTPLTTF